MTQVAPPSREEVCFFFFNDTATTEIYTLSLHDALPIFGNLKLPPARHWENRGIIHAQFLDRKSTRLNSSHLVISYAVFCLKKRCRCRSPCARPPRWVWGRPPGTRSSPGARGSFFNDTATTEIYTLSLHDALPI